MFNLVLVKMAAGCVREVTCKGVFCKVNKYENCKSGLIDDHYGQEVVL